jgi:hypothetical protein
MAKRKARKSAKPSKKAGSRRSAKRAGGRTARASGKAGAKSRRSAKRAGGRKSTARRVAAKKPKKAVARKAARKSAPRKPAARRASAPPARKAPALDRARRIVQGDDIVPTPPSTLDLDRTASAARSGRRSMVERLNEHHETSPALTAGDVDADWESAASVGDEAPGGDNPTPDQDIVDDIGRAVGVQYDDNEELKGEAKISKRDKHRWELDPASSEDYDER